MLDSSTSQDIFKVNVQLTFKGCNWQCRRDVCASANVLFELGDMNYRMDSGTGWKAEAVRNGIDTLLDFKRSIESWLKLLILPIGNEYLTIRLEFEINPITSRELTLNMLEISKFLHSFLDVK
jgi:hypothetical protein